MLKVVLWLYLGWLLLVLATSLLVGLALNWEFAVEGAVLFAIGAPILFSPPILFVVGVMWLLHWLADDKKEKEPVVVTDMDYHPAGFCLKCGCDSLYDLTMWYSDGRTPTNELMCTMCDPRVQPYPSKRSDATID